MTINDTGIIIKMLRANGQYPGDPPAWSIWSYTNMNGEKTHAVFMAEYAEDIFQSPYVFEPIVLLFTRKGGLTEEGRAMLRSDVKKYRRKSHA